MGEYILKIEENKQSVMLIKYLKTLDFISLKSKNKVLANKKSSINSKFVKFLEKLPEADYDQDSVNKAITEMRNA